jgi:hypothetical protein
MLQITITTTAEEDDSLEEMLTWYNQHFRNSSASILVPIG